MNKKKKCQQKELIVERYEEPPIVVKAWIEKGCIRWRPVCRNAVTGDICVALWLTGSVVRKAWQLAEEELD